jgi:hypothetical protein
MVPLTVEQGFPLEIVLTEKLSFKINEPVHGKIVDAIYAFDREVIPSGTEVLGKVTGFKSKGKWKRVSSMLALDFTPQRDPEITFDTLVLADGKQIPIETAVVSRGNIFLRLDKGETRTYTTTIQQPGKEMVHGLLWGLLPYHPQSMPTGTTYKVTLTEPLNFGNALVGARTLNGIASTPPPGSIMDARLMTALDSKRTKVGTVVQAVLTRPLYSMDNRLIFPAGSRLQGEVVKAEAPGMWDHSGELGLKFTRIEPPLSVMSSMSQSREIQGRLVGVQVPLELNQLRIDKDGVTEVPRTKGRFMAPAFALAGAAPFMGTSASTWGPAVAESYATSSFSRVLGGSGGFGMAGGVAGLMVPAVGLGLGAYSVTHAFITNIIGHGKNIVLPVDTRVEIRLD